MTRPVTLDDKYAATEGRVFMTGIQALVRLPLAQVRRDRAAGLDTGVFVSGYRGSPLGGYDQELMRAKRHLAEHDVHFQPGVNEDLAATAVWGSQQLHLSPGAKKQGVVGIWYGKGPGVDRCGDVFKHANAAGSATHGGVLCLAGDDHSCKSSTLPHQTDHDFMSAIMPVLYPSSIHEFLEMGLFGVALSRYSGCWVAMKFISDTVETSAAVDLAGERRTFVTPTDFEMPADGLNLRWPDPPLVQDARLQNLKGYAAIAFARANGVDQTTLDMPGARFGVIASGKAYEDVVQALKELEIGADEARAIGLKLYKVRMPWPLEPEGVRRFSEGLDEILIVEERREIIEHQVKQQLFNWRADVRPRIVGKFDDKDRPFLSLNESLTVGAAARALADRILRFDIDAGLRARISEKLAYLDARGRIGREHQAPIVRTPYFCSGCPHNTSTKVPEGSRALAGIGCHYMVTWMDRSTDTFSQMGGEGVPWVGLAPFTAEAHVFANLGDGTYFHSGLLAIRQAVASKANITYKVLYNDAVAMTGGQTVDGELSPAQVTRQLHAEGVKPIVLVTDTPEVYRARDVARDLAPGVEIRHRDELELVMESIRKEPGCSAILYVQTCAAEKRRRRKRGLMEDPDRRVFIDPTVCEGCGDCSVQSNCVSIEPLETAMGRKRRINQSSCNKDFSCLKGFCPSFVTVEGGKPRKREKARADALPPPPEPVVPALGERPWNIAVTGVGGNGVLTIGAILGMAAHIDGAAAMVLDMAGLAQKGGAVLSHIRLGRTPADVTSPKIVTGGADLLLAADDVVAASKDGATLASPERTYAIVNTKLTPVADFVRQRDFDFREAAVLGTIRKSVKRESDFLDVTTIAEAVAGDAIATNIMMTGYAWQKGLIPLSREAIESAITLNGVAVKANLEAFAWGRRLAHAPAEVAALARPKAEATAEKPLAAMTLPEIVAHRSAHLTAYQDAALAERYRGRIAEIEARARTVGLEPVAAEALTRAAAITYARLLAIKDEYEVARLLSDPSFDARLAEQFEGDIRISFNMAPPFLPGRAPNGRPKKRRFSGRWMRPALARLARLKRYRGTRFDLFGRSAERRMERALIGEWERLAARVLEGLRPEKAAAATALLALHQDVRGFGPVKEAAVETVRRRQAEMLAAYEAAPGAPSAMAAE